MSFTSRFDGKVVIFIHLPNIEYIRLIYKLNPERKSIALFLLATLTLILAFSPTVLGLLILPSTAASSSTGTIAKVSSGLVASDPLNKQLTEQQLNESSYWTFTGDAPSEKSPYNFYEDSNGLHIGVQSPGSYIYAGFFAKSPNTNFLLVHVKVSAPVSTIPRGVFESGVYVQTVNGSINYVTCTSSTTSSGTIWGAGLGNREHPGCNALLDPLVFWNWAIPNRRLHDYHQWE